MIEISEPVKETLKEILAKNPGKYVRIRVEGDGCAGPYLRVCLDEPDPGEEPVEIEGIEFLIADDIQKIARWTKIDIFLQPGDEKALTD